MSALRWMAPVLVVVLAAGPLTPMVAGAQTPTAPSQAPAPAPQPPAAPPPPAAAPQAPVTPPAQAPAITPLQPMESMQPDSVVEGSGPVAGTGARIGAGVLNVVYVPGKAIVCGAGTIVAGVMMLATFGSAYREATSFFKEGCSGAWLLTPADVAAVPKRSQFEY